VHCCAMESARVVSFQIGHGLAAEQLPAATSVVAEVLTT
jgi:hypothetical protein